MLLDVREDWEFEHCHIPDAHHVPMAQVSVHNGDFDGTAGVVCICHHGIRSLRIAHYLAQQGCRPVFNLRGGLDAWAIEVDSTMPRY